MELCSSCLFLKFGFFKSCLLGIILQLFPDFLILLLHMQKIAFPCIEIMFIFAAIKSSIVFLYYFGLLIKEFALFIFIFFLFLIHEEAATVIASQNSLNTKGSSNFILMFPFYLEHSPVLLYNNSSRVFFILILLSLVDHTIISINHFSMSPVPF